MLPRALFLLTSAALFSGAAAAVSAEPETAGYHLKSRAAFTAPVEARAPFWPIGWTKSTGQPVETTAAVPEAKLDSSQFMVSSIMLGRPSIAVINGRAYSEGEYLRGDHAAAKSGEPGAAPAAPAPTGRVQVQRIMDGKVILAAANGLMAVTLKRPEVGMRRGEDLVPVNQR